MSQSLREEFEEAYKDRFNDLVIDKRSEWTAKWIADRCAEIASEKAEYELTECSGAKGHLRSIASGAYDSAISIKEDIEQFAKELT